LIDPQKVNPHSEEAQAIAKTLCKDAGIHLSTFDGYNTMSAFLYPNASLERLVGLIVIMNFLYYIDEVYERHERQETDRNEDIYLREVFDHCVQIILYGKMPDRKHELYDASLMIHKTVLPLTNERWFKGFIIVILQHLKSTTYNLEDILDENNDDPIEAYIALRELDCGMRPTMHMIEFANNFYLSDEVKAHPYIRSVEEPTANIAGLMNDIISYEKEVLQFNSRFNLVALLEDYKELSFEAAVHEAVKIVNQNTNDFLEREKQIPDFGDEKTNEIVRQYVQGLRDQINATWHWQMATDRYRSPNSPYPELRT
jgi:hypothetical protein